jgi:tetratricopeptide (TPR) repeat protein
MSERIVLKWKPLIVSTLLLLVVGGFHSTPGQTTPSDVPIGEVSDFPRNPPINNKNLNGARSSRIEQVIKNGNLAREAGDYDKAFASYTQVAEKLNPKDARAFYGLGNVYFDLACTESAVRAYTDALRINPNLHDASIALGYVSINDERYDDATAQFRAVLKKTPQNVRAMIGLAYTAAKKKQYDEAIKQFDLIIANRLVKDQDRAAAYLYMGDIHLEQEHWEEAARNYQKALEHNPDLSIAYVRLGQTELFPAMAKFSLLATLEMRVEDRQRVVNAGRKAAEYIGTAINAHKYRHPYGNLYLAQALLYQFNYREAELKINEYRGRVKTLEDQSSLLGANCSRGFKQLDAFGFLWFALLRNQQAAFETNEAQKDLYLADVLKSAEQMIQVRPSDPEGYQLLGQTYLRKAKYAEAVQQFETALLYQTNEKTKGLTLDLIGFCYEQAGQDKEAIRAYNAAIKLRQKSLTSLLGLARISHKNGDFTEAIRLKSEVLESTPDRTAFYYWQLALSYFGRARQQNSEADYEEASKLLKKALELSQSFVPAYVALGDVYKFYKDGAYADEAFANYQQAERYEPKSAAIKLKLGDLFYVRKKNYSAAINYFEEAIRLKPDYSEAHWELGMVYIDKKNDDKAIEHLKTALVLNDMYLNAYLALSDIYERQRRYDEAINIWLKAADRLPFDYLPHKELARLYSGQQKNEEAIRSYEEAISRLKADQEWFGEVMRCRIIRLRGQFGDSITCVQNIKLPSAGDPAQIPYEIGLTHVASKNKEAAFTMYEQLKRMNSNLAESLLRAINEMK